MDVDVVVLVLVELSELLGHKTEKSEDLIGIKKKKREMKLGARLSGCRGGARN